MVGRSRAKAMSRTIPLLTELLAPIAATELDRHLSLLRVRLVTGGQTADAATQAIVATLANLLVRSGMTIQVDQTLGSTAAAFPGFGLGRFGAGLDAAVPLMFPGARVDHSASPPDFAIVLGGAPSPLAPESTVRVDATGRLAHVRWGPSREATWKPANALVALAAAGLASMELHKAALRALPLRSRTAVELLARSDTSFTLPFELPEAVDVGRLDVISGGAISQNAIWTFAAVDGLPLTSESSIVTGSSSRMPTGARSSESIDWAARRSTRFGRYSPAGSK